MPSWFPALHNAVTYIFTVPIDSSSGIFGTIGSWIPVAIIVFLGTRAIDNLLNS